MIPSPERCCGFGRILCSDGLVILKDCFEAQIMKEAVPTESHASILQLLLHVERL